MITFKESWWNLGEWHMEIPCTVSATFLKFKIIYKFLKSGILRRKHHESFSKLRLIQGQKWKWVSLVVYRYVNRKKHNAYVINAY